MLLSVLVLLLQADALGQISILEAELLLRSGQGSKKVQSKAGYEQAGYALHTCTFLCEGWLVISARGQSPKHSELLLAMTVALQRPHSP